jgi:hypothetical protein
MNYIVETEKAAKKGCRIKQQSLQCSGGGALHFFFYFAW